MIEYYNIMKRLQLEFYYYQNFKMKCSEDATMLQLFVKREFLLADLNVEHGQACIQVLDKETLRSLNEVFQIIQAEEGQTTVVFGTASPDGLALVSVKPNVDLVENYNGGNANLMRTEGPKPLHGKGGLCCNYCKKP